MRWSDTRWLWISEHCLDQRQFPWPDKQFSLISKISGPDFFSWTAVQGKSRVSRVALFRGLFSQAVEITSEKLGIPANTEYQPFPVH